MALTRQLSDEFEKIPLAAIDHMDLESIILGLDEQDILIEATRQLSDIDRISRGTEPRILLDQADLRLAHLVADEAASEQKDEDTVCVTRAPSYVEVHRQDTSKQDSLKELTLTDTGLSSDKASSLLEIHGLNKLPDRRKPLWLLFCQQLWQPMPIMIWIAVIILACIDNFIDMGILLLIQFANATIAYYELSKARKAVESLQSSLSHTGKFIATSFSLSPPPPPPPPHL